MNIKKNSTPCLRSCAALYRNHWLHGLGLLCCLYAVMQFSGCSLVVLAGKVLFDDPKAPAKFELGTGTDLEKGKHKILVVATAPFSATMEGHALDLDILEGVTRRVKRKGVKVVNSDKVATWLDNNGGSFDDPNEILEEFKTDYIVHISVDNYSYLEENSTTMYRGRCAGTVTVYAVREIKQDKDKDDEQDEDEEDDDKEKYEALEIWSSGYSSLYPQSYPISQEQVAPELFQQQFIDRLCTQLGQMFYAHRLSDTIE